MSSAHIPLTTAQLVDAYQAFLKSPDLPSHRAEILKEVTFVRSMHRATFLLPATQERLWNLENVASAGQGRAVSVSEAIVDPAFLDELDRMRSLSLPDDVDQRASMLQAECDRLLDILVQRKLTRVKPRAKLTRLMLVLFPNELHCALNWEFATATRRLVIGETRDMPIEAMVKCRQRLREELGAETGDDDRVDRILFCWHIAETIAIGDSGAVVTTVRRNDEDAKRKLVPLPVANQRKGITAVQGYLETWRAVVNAAVGGGSEQHILDDMRSFGVADLARKSRSNIFNQVRTFEFLKYENNLWYPTEDGIRLIQDDPANVLIERFLVRNYGLAQVLRLLKSNGPATRSTVYAELRARYPNWKTDFAPSAILQWSMSLGIVEFEGGTCRLTELGEEWEARLPENLPDPVSVSSSGDSEVGDDFASSYELDDVEQSSGWSPPSFDQILVLVRERTKLVIDEDILRAIHSAWHCNPGKRFVLLSGLSGTGKTAIVMAYADAYCEIVGVKPSGHRQLIPVAPDWRDPTGLLGYLNTLQDEPTWHREPALNLLLDAADSPDKPFFLLLDEMNLSFVEQYFAPFLSAMETNAPISLHAEDGPVNGVPPIVRWPSNLFIAGTMNMDETTHRISDKVLDRAFTIEFWNVNLDLYFETSAEASAEVKAMLRLLHEALSTVRRQFGYRTAGEIIAFCNSFPGGDLDTALDLAISCKILPKLRGDATEAMRRVLKAVRTHCPVDRFPRSATKLTEMEDRLSLHGATHFWS